MNKKTWETGNLTLSYENPQLTALSDDIEEIQSMEQVMYFYYDIEIKSKDKKLFSSCTHDFPKVQYLPNLIENALHIKEEDKLLMESVKDGGYERVVKYNQFILEDDFGLDMEYFYKLERYEYIIKHSPEGEVKKWIEYVLTIGEMNASDSAIGSERGDHGNVVMIKNITEKELLSLKNVAEDFCEEAIISYNKEEGTEQKTD